MRKIDNFVIGLIRYREGGGGNLSLGRHIFYKSVGSILNLEKKMILNHLYLSGNALEFWICGCRCILESSGSQNSRSTQNQKPQNQRVQKMMSQRFAGSCTCCTCSNAFPESKKMKRIIIIYASNVILDPQGRNEKKNNFVRFWV